MEGWIKSHRKSLYSAVFRSAKLWQVWSYCLFRANHKGGYKDIFRGRQIELKRGQFITGRFNGANDCNMKPTTFSYELKKLKKFGNITIESDNHKSVITIVNWAQYQHTDGDIDSSTDNQLTTDCQQIDTDKNERMKRKKGSSYKAKAKAQQSISEEEEGWQ